MTNPTLRPLSEARIAETAALLGRAFADDPGYVYALPSAPRRPTQLRWLYERIVRVSMPFEHVYGAGDDRSELAAVTVWMPPGRGPGPVDMIRHGLLLFPLHVGPSATVRLMRCLVHMERVKAEIFRKRPHWYLDQLAVDPARQGQGLGRFALQQGIEDLLARERAPLMLFTSKEKNVAFYQASGFAVTRNDWIGEPQDGFRLWTMQREA
ncbi:puromycin N-acetyltransferase, putative [Minicystis rosea]|nr:puromycin N-acetyltransferase, putative [Minicystis rosea]